MVRALKIATKFLDRLSGPAEKGNPLKVKISWVKPDFKSEAGEYFENPVTKDFFAKRGLIFKDKKELINFFDTGYFKVLNREQLHKNFKNMSLTDEDFREELKNPEYALSYGKMVSDLEETGKVTLPSPITVNFDGLYYGFSGNRRMNLAFRYNMPIRFWVVDYKAGN